MTCFGNEIIVDWLAGDIRHLLQQGVWLNCQVRNKEKWLREMDSDLNHQAKVRVILDAQLLELFLFRQPSNENVADGLSAGKWVKLDNFSAVAEEAKRLQ